MSVNEPVVSASEEYGPEYWSNWRTRTSKIPPHILQMSKAELVNNLLESEFFIEPPDFENLGEEIEMAILQGFNYLLEEYPAGTVKARVTGRTIREGDEMTEEAVADYNRFDRLYRIDAEECTKVLVAAPSQHFREQVIFAIQGTVVHEGFHQLDHDLEPGGVEVLNNVIIGVTGNPYALHPDLDLAGEIFVTKDLNDYAATNRQEMIAVAGQTEFGGLPSFLGPAVTSVMKAVYGRPHEQDPRVVANPDRFITPIHRRRTKQGYEVEDIAIGGNLKGTSRFRYGDSIGFGGGVTYLDCGPGDGYLIEKRSGGLPSRRDPFPAVTYRVYNLRESRMQRKLVYDDFRHQDLDMQVGNPMRTSEDVARPPHWTKKPVRENVAVIGINAFDDVDALNGATTDVVDCLSREFYDLRIKTGEISIPLDRQEFDFIYNDPEKVTVEKRDPFVYGNELKPDRATDVIIEDIDGNQYLIGKNFAATHPVKDGQRYYVALHYHEADVTNQVFAVGESIAIRLNESSAQQHGITEVTFPPIHRMFVREKPAVSPELLEDLRTGNLHQELGRTT